MSKMCFAFKLFAIICFGFSAIWYVEVQIDWKSFLLIKLSTAATVSPLVLEEQSIISHWKWFAKYKSRSCSFVLGSPWLSTPMILPFILTTSRKSPVTGTIACVG